jgi:hypothetical protein
MSKSTLVSKALVLAARIAAILVLQVVAQDISAYGQSIVLSPGETPEGATKFSLRVRRADGEPFVTDSRVIPSVGIAFGPNLVMVKATPDRAKAPRSLIVTIEDLAEIWNPAPRIGDNLLVAVYLKKKPITAAAILPVVATEVGSFPEPSHLRSRKKRARLPAPTISLQAVR